MNKSTELQFDELFVAGEEDAKDEPRQGEEDGEDSDDRASNEYVALHKLDAQGRVKERKSKMKAQEESLGEEKEVEKERTPSDVSDAGEGKRKQHLTLDDFTLLKLVGKGGYGKVQAIIVSLRSCGCYLSSLSILYSYIVQDTLFRSIRFERKKREKYMP